MFHTFANLTASESEVGWTVENRPHKGGSAIEQTWVTPVEFPFHGVITHWRYMTGYSVPFRAMVLRNVDSSGTLYDIIGINDIPAGEIDQILTYQVPDDERISVLAGDVLGFGWNIPGVKHTRDTDANTDGVVRLLYKQFSPDGYNVNDRIDASAYLPYVRAYSIKAIVSGIVNTIILNSLGK